ncbi:MAG: family 20 glycosylhydrolase [Bacteroidales bacterium]|nr:family 20 glycosylhydrolase [Candidatus Physcousia equi]
MLMKHTLTLLLMLASCLFGRAAEPMDWRGIMIDVSRHFMPLDFLYRQVDAMQHFGLNKLHLHLTDAAGWRMEIKSRPRLTEVGAWRPEANWQTWWDGDRHYGGSYGGYYTQEELRQLVTYAMERGVDIVPEIEFPAHSEEVVAAYPELGFNHAELDMQKSEVYRFMRDVLCEVADVFPSEYLHLGGDEAATQHELQPIGMRQVKHIVDSLGRKMIVWDEALTDEPADSTMVIMVWRNPDTAKKAIDLHHPVIMCPGAWCYFDKCQDAPMTQPRSAGGYLPLEKVYAFRPLPDVLGIQGNVWTEHIATPDHAEHMLWPRAIAIAQLASGEHLAWDVFRQKAVEGTRWLRDTLGVNAFNLDTEVGERPERGRPIRCATTGCNVSYNTPFHPAYPAAGECTLTDGLQGGWSNTDGRWQGFIGRRGMDVTIDLGRRQRLSCIEASFLQSTGPEIFLPSQLIISASNDGTNFTTLQHTTLPDSPAPERYETLGWKGHTRTRFIRFQAVPGARQGWIFCDEIMAR